MFWVIFDTSSRKDYYRDVHNLLALPRGAIIRYDYRVGNVADSANALWGQDFDRSVLLMYAQSRDYRKGNVIPDARAESTLAYDGALWIPTRIARLRFLGKEIDRLVFDLEVRGYPLQDATLIRRCVTTIVARSDAPYNKWVATYEDDDLLAAISVGEDAKNWAGVVDAVGSPPSQFSGDTFWRVVDVVHGTGNRAVKPAYERQSKADGANEEVTGVSAIYACNELELVGVEIQSRAVGQASETEPSETRSIEFATEADSPLVAFAKKGESIRRNKTYVVRCEIAASDRAASSRAELSMRTAPDKDGYVTGPQFSIAFSIGPKVGRRAAAWIAAFAAAVLAAIAADTIKQNTPVGIALFGLALAVGGIATYLWRDRIPFPGGKG